jgi:hypothetical protein
MSRDSIDETARIAVDAHERGDIDLDTLTSVLSDLIDARALQNGYADKHGLPSQQRSQRKP